MRTFEETDRTALSGLIITETTDTTHNDNIKKNKITTVIFFIRETHEKLNAKEISRFLMTITEKSEIKFIGFKNLSDCADVTFFFL